MSDRLMPDAPNMSRRACLGLGASAALSLAVSPAHAAVATTVVELFTSQSCSSCPPADEFAGELRKTPGIAVLTYHVDYWDYRGWKDTLGAPEFSRRQYDYAKARGDMEVYTPQMIVNGERHFVGGNRGDVLAEIERRRTRPWSAEVTVRRGGEDVILEAGEGQVDGEAMLWLMAILPAISVKIERGEMAGRIVAYRNVVRRIVPVGMWHGKPVSFNLMASAVLPPDCTGCVAILQRGKAGPILGVGLAGDVMA